MTQLEENLEIDNKEEAIPIFKEFLKVHYDKEILACAYEKRPLIVDFMNLDKYSSGLALYLLKKPEEFFEVAQAALEDIEKPSEVIARFINLPDSEVISIRDLRARHLGRFIQTEGIVRKASEIRPEVMKKIWKCNQCGNLIEIERKGDYIPTKPFECDCGNRKGFQDFDKTMIDMRWVVVEEPFELTEGERPSQLTLVLKDELVNPEGRRLTDPGNRLKLTGVLKDIPRGKHFSPKLEFYLDINCVEPTETGWERVEVTPEDEEKIIELSKDEYIYEKLVASLAPSLFGLDEVKESIIMQLFGGVPRTLSDKTNFRGNIHILIIGDPAAGKSQLLKLVPQIVPRGKYVSGKGATTAGLTATVSKDEQFMGGWVLEAGAMVLANKGLLSVDEFEKMTAEDQIAMHEALEQGTVSVAKASIVATLPANTSVLAGGNPKFSRFDPYMPIAKQITIVDSLLTRFDLKFALRDLPESAQDTRLVEHVLKSREEGSVLATPAIDPELIRKYIAYAREKCVPMMTQEASDILKTFYLGTRKKAEGGNSPIPITLRQFEALMRLSEASAKINLSATVRKSDAQRAIRLMQFSLRQLGFDPETGTIDVDKAEGGTTSKERSEIRIIIDIINDLSENNKEILIAQIEELGKKENVKNTEDLIERLMREGMLFSPKPGYVQKV